MAEADQSETIITENETARPETFTEKTGATLSKDPTVQRAEAKARRAPDPTRKYRLGLIVLGVFALAELLGCLYLLLLNAEKLNEISNLKAENRILETELRSFDPLDY